MDFTAYHKEIEKVVKKKIPIEKKLSLMVDIWTKHRNVKPRQFSQGS